MKTLMMTVMKTKMVAALLSWFSRHCFSTSLRFSRAVEKGEWQVRVWVGGGGHSLELPPPQPLESRESLVPQRSREVAAIVLRCFLPH